MAYSTYGRNPTNQSDVRSKPIVATLSVTVPDTLASALLADARRLQRPQEELDSLTNLNSKIAALASQLRGLGTKPGERTRTRSLVAQMNNLALDMSHSEATALGLASAQLWRDMAKPPVKTIAADASAAIAKAEQAKINLDNMLAVAQRAQDGIVALKATRQALDGYDAFAAACDAAAPFYVSARRGDFAALAAAAHGISDRLVALGRVSKPWLFASRARKDAYQTLADNATEAQSQVAQLAELERRASAATSLRKISAALSRASTIKARLSSLLMKSNAAYSTYNQ